MVRLLGILAAVFVFLLLPGGAVGAGAIDADVENVATVTSSNTTVFEFSVYNCPANALITVTWDAQQPDRPGQTVSTPATPFIASGDSVEHVVVGTNGDFIPGHRWVGSGIVTCNAEVIPVEGSGQTKSLNGV